MSSVPDRSEVDEQYKWDLGDLFASEEEWEAAFDEVESRVAEFEAYEGRVAEDAETLQGVLELREELSRTLSDVAAYARMRKDEDTTDQQFQALSSRAQSLSADLSSAASFVEPELQQCDRETLRSFLEENSDLQTYEHYFDDVLRMKPHTRSPEVEELLADLSEVTGGAGEVYNMLANADMEFPAVEDPDGETQRITLSNFTALQKSPDREFRERVHDAFYEEWETVRNSVATAYENSVTADSKLASARNYDTARRASIDQANVPVEVYDNLLETVGDNLDVLHRHVDLKRDRLGVDEVEMYDLYAPLTEDELDDIEYEQAKEWVVEAVAPLGEEYQQAMAEGLESRWVDVYENEGKRSGAYSGGTYDSQPYILMNYQSDVSSMFTLAHELGHSMHTKLASEHQPYVYSGYEIFVAEVASTVNEALLTEHLLDTVEDETFRRHLLDEYLERFRSTLFRQTMFADFEHRTHRISEDGGALTPDRLDELYGDLKRDYYANAAVDDHVTREWMRIPHFYYRYPSNYADLNNQYAATDLGPQFYHGFYVYQYSTGISSAVAIAKRIREEGASAAQQYLDALRLGGSEYPIDILETAGVDVTNTRYIEDAIDEYERRVANFEELI